MNIFKFIQWLKDKKRGYTEKDIDSMFNKFEKYEPRPGGIVELTIQEYRAFLNEERNKMPKFVVKAK